MKKGTSLILTYTLFKSLLFNFKFDYIQQIMIYYSYFACTAVIATTPTISSDEQPLLKSFTGFFMP